MDGSRQSITQDSLLRHNNDGVIMTSKNLTNLKLFDLVNSAHRHLQSSSQIFTKTGMFMTNTSESLLKSLFQLSQFWPT